MDTTLKGVQFLVQTQENLTWMLFASEPIELTLNGISRRTITADKPYTGILRWALVPPPFYDDNRNRHTSNYHSVSPLDKSSGIRRLIYHSHIYPIGSKVSWNFHEETGRTIGALSFDFETRSMHDEDVVESTDLNVTHTNADSESLLMLALPHHAQTMSHKNLVEQFDINYESIKGTMAPFIGSKWTYEEKLTEIDFEGDIAKEQVAKMDEKTKDIILKQVTRDLTRVLPTMDENVYGYGKQVARLAQLAHIAHQVELHGHNSAYGPVTTKAVELLHYYLSEFFESKNDDVLIYDVSFGGMVSKNGLTDKQDDFGNGWYNDHHFHYGYLLYASAMMAKMNSTFVSEFGPNVDALMHDVTYHGNMGSHDLSQAFFPSSRHKSW